MYNFTPRGTCSRNISFDIVDGKVHGVSFTAGCNGNLKAIGVLVEGMDAHEAIRKLKGINCGNRGTSCGDQLACALEDALSAGVAA